MPTSALPGSEQRLGLHGLKRAQYGTERERRRSANISGILLYAVVACSLYATTLVTNHAVAKLRPGTQLTLFLGLALFAAITAGLEWTRNAAAERFSLATGAWGTVMTFIAILNGWWYYAPYLGLATLGVLLATAHRLMVRDEARHTVTEHSYFH